MKRTDIPEKPWAAGPATPEAHRNCAQPLIVPGLHCSGRLDLREQNAFPMLLRVRSVLASDRSPQLPGRFEIHEWSPIRVKAIAAPNRPQLLDRASHSL
jgi:hypothetical protein